MSANAAVASVLHVPAVIELVQQTLSGVSVFDSYCPRPTPSASVASCTYQHGLCLLASVGVIASCPTSGSPMQPDLQFGLASHALPIAVGCYAVSQHLITSLSEMYQAEVHFKINAWSLRCPCLVHPWTALKALSAHVGRCSSLVHPMLSEFLLIWYRPASACFNMSLTIWWKGFERFRPMLVLFGSVSAHAGKCWCSSTGPVLRTSLEHGGWATQVCKSVSREVSGRNP